MNSHPKLWMQRAVIAAVPEQFNLNPAVLGESGGQESNLRIRIAGSAEPNGEEETGKAAGRHYLLLEGTDAKVHLIYYTPEMEEARSRGKLSSNSFVRLRKQFENGRPVLDIEDSGDAERILHNKRHFGERASGIAPLEGAWGGWLGRYHTALSKAATGAVEFQVDRPRPATDRQL